MIIDQLTLAIVSAFKTVYNAILPDNKAPIETTRYTGKYKDFEYYGDYFTLNSYDIKDNLMIPKTRELAAQAANAMKDNEIYHIEMIVKQYDPSTSAPDAIYMTVGYKAAKKRQNNEPAQPKENPYLTDEYKQRVKKSDELQKLAAPLVDFLYRYYNPHATIMITQTNAEVVEGSMSVPFEPRD